MTDATLVLAIVSLAIPLAGALVLALVRDPRVADRISAVAAIAAAGAALALAGLSLSRPGRSEADTVFLVDATTGIFVAVIAVVGLLSTLVAPAHLATVSRSVFPPGRRCAWYHAAFHLFWAFLLAIPLVANLGVAWLLVEATTAASALLVGFSGRRSALEAGWKYLVLTTVGLTFALLGIVILFSAGPEAGFVGLDFVALRENAAGIDKELALAAYALIVVGLAAKIGWAPLHNWLPDAHSEAPPPVSALLSAALLPSVMLVAWRASAALSPAVGAGAVRALFIGFGLVSLAVAVPFLWRQLAWKRLLAYSSLEHMGVLGLGIGFANRVALAGVVLHVCGHALAKSLGFYAAIPLARIQPSSARRPIRGLGHANRATAAAVGLSLSSLAGLPPLPLFFSEVFVLVGGALAGEIWVVAVAATLLALGFLGLAHALVEGLGGGRRSSGEPVDGRWIAILGGAVAASLLGLSAAAIFMPDSTLVEALWALPR